LTAVRSFVLLALSVLVGGLLALVAGSTPASTAATDLSKPPPVRHVFVINLENLGYDETFGPDSPAPYLSRTLRGKGQLLTQYYGTAHNSLPNYLAQVSGQGPNPQTQGDCQVYSDFVDTRDARSRPSMLGHASRAARASSLGSSPTPITPRITPTDLRCRVRRRVSTPSRMGTFAAASQLRRSPDARQFE